MVLKAGPYSISNSWTPASGIAESYGNWVQLFVGLLDYSFSKSAVPFYISTSSMWGFQSLHFLPNTPHLCLVAEGLGSGISLWFLFTFPVAGLGVDPQVSPFPRPCWISIPGHRWENIVWWGGPREGSITGYHFLLLCLKGLGLLPFPVRKLHCTLGEGG